MSGVVDQMTDSMAGQMDAEPVLAADVSQEMHQQQDNQEALPEGVAMDGDSQVFHNIDNFYMTFEEMNLRPELLRGIYGHGFEKPSAIQSRAIVPISTGRDCIAQAQSGTGKTATFAIGVLQKIDVTKRATQCIILAPTRELAQQIRSVVCSFSQVLGATCEVAIGGTQVRDNAAALNRAPHIVVGTPGRILDMIVKRKAINARSITTFVLDEADEMLSRGFLEQIQEILYGIPRDAQVVLVSATMPPEILKISETFMTNPAQILVKNEELTLEGIGQYFCNAKDDTDKLEILLDVFKALMLSQTVVFCNTKRCAEELTHNLRIREHEVACIHGEMQQNERSEILKRFRCASARILVSTNLLARGIDVQQLSLVVNYEMPSDLESYLHRIGRGGRFGRKGAALNLVTPAEAHILPHICEFYQTQIKPLPSVISEILK